MSVLAAHRAAIKAKLESVPDIGVVHGYERYSKRSADLLTMYEFAGQIRGWFIRRVSTAERPGACRRIMTRFQWQIRGYMALDDATGSELVFDGLIEAARDAFRADEDLGGVVHTTTDKQQTGLQLQDAGPVMFAGVLCHAARMGLFTEEVQ